MQKILQYILPFKLPLKFPNNELNALYHEWDKPSRQLQISAISFLTALLYVIFTFIDKSSWAPEQVQTLMQRVHLLIIVPMMLTISFLAYNKEVLQICDACACRIANYSGVMQRLSC